MMNKNNVPYYIAGTLATFTLLASGVFAAAPYAQFLASVAALSVGLPFIIGCAVFSVVTIALSYKAISKNKTISEKEKEIEELKHKKTFVPQAIKNIKEASQEVFAYVAEAYSSGRVHSTIKQRRSDVANDLKNVVGSAKNAYGTSVEYAMGTLNAVGSSVKSVYDTSVGYTMETLNAVGSGVNKVYNPVPSIESVKGTLGSGVQNTCGTSVGYIKGALNSVGSSLYSRLYGTKVSSKEQFKREDGSKPSMQELTHLGCLDLATSKNLNHLKVEVSSPGSQPAEKEETTANWLASQATKAIPYLVMSCLPYVFYNYYTTPASASFDDFNVTQPFVTDCSRNSTVL